jgi:hypothetical protein
MDVRNLGSMLYIMGSFFSRLIGVIYVSEKEPNLVRIAHMTFWGTRQDDVFTKLDLMPFSELPDHVQDVYIHVATYSDPHHPMFLSLKYGSVLDKEEFEGIFGTIPGLRIVKEMRKKKSRSSDASSSSSTDNNNRLG